jgi:hypothetical protein
MIDINWRPSRTDLRVFSIACLVFSVGVGTALYLKVGPGKLVHSLWTIGPVVALFGLVWPPSVRYLYIGLALVALPIGLVLGNVLMALTYYLVVTPVGLVFRLIGRDSLNRKPDSDADSYWVRRPPPAPIKRYFRQH